MAEELEKKKFDVKFEDGKMELSIDSNLDGEKLIYVSVNMNEALQEVIKRGEPVEGVKLVDFEFSTQKIVLKLDTDKDGEKLLEIELNLAEALDESGLLK